MASVSLSWYGDQVSQAAAAAADAGLQAAAAQALAESQAIVPYDTGDLSRSGKSGLVDKGRAAVTYTDSAAVPAHEKLNVPPAGGRRRKYLESVISGRQRDLLAVIADEMRGRLR